MIISQTELDTIERITALPLETPEDRRVFEAEITAYLADVKAPVTVPLLTKVAEFTRVRDVLGNR